MAEQADKAARRLFETNSAFADAACAQLTCTDTIRSGLWHRAPLAMPLAYLGIRNNGHRRGDERSARNHRQRSVLFLFNCLAIATTRPVARPASPAALGRHQWATLCGLLPHRLAGPPNPVDKNQAELLEPNNCRLLPTYRLSVRRGQAVG